MTNAIEDILVCIHDEPDMDEHTKLGRMVREVDAHLVPFGHYTATERVRIGRAFRDKNLGTQLSDRIADMIHNGITSPRCPSARQPNLGRRSTYRRGKVVQTTGTSSLPQPGVSIIRAAPHCETTR